MGPSGAGKSTLLDVLSGRQSATKGEMNLHSAGESIKTISNYVEQDDALLEFSLFERHCGTLPSWRELLL
jgi:ABC-type nitrate/sulfonate/bicarbonate transport system ATPase subunit